PEKLQAPNTTPRESCLNVRAGHGVSEFGIGSFSGALSLVIGALGVWCAGPARGADTNDPAVELASFKVRDGYEVNLFASEADGIAHPIQSRCGASARLFVACGWVYPQLEPGQKADDKIMVLEDTDGDGRADKSIVFADG